jgi:hypothetical protein
MQGIHLPALEILRFSIRVLFVEFVTSIEGRDQAAIF